MMKPEDINSIEDAQRYVEGCVNDYGAGLSTKGELLGFLGEYTGRLMELFWHNAKKRIIENPELLKS
jgi:hypothetical protein